MPQAIVKRSDDALAQAEAERLAAEIVALGEQGDAQTLTDVAEELDARIAYFRRQKILDAIRRGAQLKFLAEAEMGDILLRGEWPTEIQIDRNMRRWWKALAIGRRRGALESVVKTVLDRHETGTHRVCEELSRRGVLRVPNGALKDAWESSDVSIADICKTINASRRNVEACFGIRQEPTSISWVVANNVAAELKVDGSTLPRANKTRSRSRKRMWIRRQRKLTGGRWDETYVKFRTALDEFARVAGEDVKWDEAYSHWYALEQSLVRAMKREQ